VTAFVEDPVITVDVPTRTRTGQPIWLNMTAVSGPVNGEGAVAVHLFRDVTAMRKFLTVVRPTLDPSAADGGAALPSPASLTPRELEVLRLLGQGLGTAAAAERLHISGTTIRNHVQRILAKLGVHSRLQAVAYAGRHRLL
jgi:DNA-binding NarL/FixJ family response regulator